MKKKLLPLLLLLCCLLHLTGCAEDIWAASLPSPPQWEETRPAPADPDPQVEADLPPEPDPGSVPPPDSSFSIHFIDVGQADAALVECDGHYMLIDGGNRDDSSTLYSVLKGSEISHLDLVVATHPHEDHIGGLPGAFNYADAALTLSPTDEYDTKVFETFREYAQKKGGGITIPQVGDSYPLGSAHVEILGVNGGTDTNDTSIVLMITYGETRFLFTGDAETEAEQTILRSGADLSADLLKVGHHGSDTSTTYPFLREIMPQYAVISVGRDNSYGHPTEAALSRLEDADAAVYRTDLQGDIFCTSDGTHIRLSTAKNPEAHTLTPPSAPDPEPEPEPEEESAPLPTEETYVLNTKSKKFHRPDCSGVAQMSEANKDRFTGSPGELTAQGYEPCGSCRP